MNRSIVGEHGQAVKWVAATGLIGVVLLVVTALQDPWRVSGDPAHVDMLHFIELIDQGEARPRISKQAEKPLRLFLRPSENQALKCDPLLGGSVDIAVLNPTGTEVATARLPLKRPIYEGFEGIDAALDAKLLTDIPGVDGWLIWMPERYPTATDADKLTAWIPRSAGSNFVLRLDWRCDGSEMRQEISFDVHEKQDLDNCPTEDSKWQPSSSENENQNTKRNVWLAECQVERHLRNGDSAEAARIALEASNLAEDNGLLSKALHLRLRVASSAKSGLGGTTTALLYKIVADATSLDYLDYLPRYLEALLVHLIEEGDLAEAWHVASQYRDVSIRTGNRRRVHLAAMRRADILARLGQIERAQRYVRAFEDQLKGLHIQDPTLSGNMGWLHLQLGNLSAIDTDWHLARAATHTQTALSYWLAYASGASEKDPRLPEAIANEQLNLAQIRLYQGNLTAMEELLDGPFMEKRIKAGTVELQRRWLHGRLASARGEFEDAAVRFQDLIEAAIEADKAEYRDVGYFELGRVLRAQGRIGLALQQFKNALNGLRERSTSVGSTMATTLLFSQPLWWSEAAVLLLEASGDTAALELLEQRDWLRLQRLRTTESRGHQNPEQRVRLAALEDLLPAWEEQAKYCLRTEQATDNCSEIRLRVNELKEQRDNLLYASRTLDLPEMNEATLQSWMVRGRVVVRGAILGDQAAVWHITTDHEGASQVHGRLLNIGSKELISLIEAFASSCRAGTPNHEAGSALSDILLGDLRTNPPPEILVAGDSIFHELPWVALPLEKSDGDAVLVERTAIGHVSSLLETSQEVRETPQRALLAVDPEGQFAPYANQEALNIAPLMHHSEIKSGKEVIRGWLMEAIDRVDIIHLITHGVVDPDHPFASHLRLTAGEQLTLLDVRGLDLTSRRPLVFMNACHGGTVAERSGGGLSMIDGFLAAGAGAVVASRWEIPSKVGPLTSPYFYNKYLMGGRELSTDIDDKTQVSFRSHHSLAAMQRAAMQGQLEPLAQNSSVWSAWITFVTSR